MSQRAAGGQSPPPERQTGAQMNDPPADGKRATGSHFNKDDDTHQADDQLRNLTSNPEGPMDDNLRQKYGKLANQGINRKPPMD